ncbi:hypothetical protein AMIS_19610 [Actinoplanes missouriensis 431]|uniref:Uncharacterized protein n=1 Tax=Actinoplanes missouriensis (strain ATCC 14538 / DSM 43046 / CBS 188.64 / JCM 3121 / NBRC 102363 / NCIMB 12654 / NRRL B-3342 / UNCC 431) TaxID=512565 RepID=I0H2E4_ACTM4|nr:hypothetical protein [Actinoplanes missouriensis]BAL87181.1 hypothetical protein AMIS_19610 [Actinoplanes missouriensis 431]
MTTTWTPPPSVSLSSNDIRTVMAGLTDPDHRDAALAFIDTLVDDGLVYVIACEIAYRRREPRPPVGGNYLAFIRDRV